MPSDANGVFSLVNGYLAETGETIQASQHNPPLEDIASSMTQRVMRSGATPMTGPLKAANGSAAAPALTFNSATGTGVYKTTNGFGIAVDGVLAAEFTASGMSKGGRFLGELIPYTGATAPPLTVLPYGQTLNRADYPDFWTFVQAAIAAGNNSFYNNGNGTTTFGIGDLRGRVPAGVDNMGGTTANRLINGSMAGVRHTIGGVGGADTNTLTVAKTPSHFHGAGISDPGHSHTYAGPTSTFIQLSGAPAPIPTANSTTSTSFTGVRVASDNGLDTTYSAGGGEAHDNLQPTILTIYLLFVGA